MISVHVVNHDMNREYEISFNSEAAANKHISEVANGRPYGHCPTKDSNGDCHCHITIKVWEKVN